MESRTFTAIVLLGLLTTASCQPPQLPIYESLEAEPQADRQIGALILGLITPALTNLVTIGVVNLASAVYNAIASTFAGKRLELITMEGMLATPITESDAPAAPAAHSYTPGGMPPKRRPYVRAMALVEDKLLQSSDPTISSSS